MEPPDALCAVAPGAQQLRYGIPVSERAAQAPKIVLVIGQQMSPTQVEQLDAVLESTQEPVRQREAFAVLSPDVAVVDQRLECGQGARRAEAFVCATVDELQKLHRKFDVAQSALAQLEFAILISGWNVGNHALAHGLSVGDEVLPLRRAPNHRRNHLDEILTEFTVAGTGPRLEHRLELPGLGPLLVVDAMARQGSDQLACLALRPKRGVHLPDGPGRRVRRADPCRLRRQPRGYRDGSVAGDQRLAALVNSRLGTEKYVHITYVV